MRAVQFTFAGCTAHKCVPEKSSCSKLIIQAAEVGYLTAKQALERLWKGISPTLTNKRKVLELGVPLIPRIITEMAHSETGIDIHPAAKIGSHFTIDHGTGVVIGATSIIGNNVKLYQGVTLGAKSFPLDADGKPIKGIPRHPILEDNVIVYSNATILGRITIGRDATVGGNIWVTENVPAGARIVQTKAKK